MTSTNQASSAPSGSGSSASEPNLSSGESRPPRIRLHFLDGIRGLAALYVLIFHSVEIDVPQEGQDLSIIMQVFRAAFGYGHFAVAVFIVLSGFSLTLSLRFSSSSSRSRAVVAAGR